MLLHGRIERVYRVVADLFEVLQASSQNVDCSHVFSGLDSEVHRALGGMWDGVSAEGDIGAGRKRGC